MKDVRFELVDSVGLTPYIASLRELEQSIRYPIADGADHFFIDHGAEYHPFFSSLGKAYFLLALHGNRVVGSISGVLRDFSFDGRSSRALYLCDLKVAPDQRGRGLSRDLVWNGLRHVAQRPDLRQTRFFYGAAMQGAQGDVMRSARGVHPFRMSNRGVRLHLYFAAPKALASLRVAGAPPPPKGPGLDLSAGARAPETCSTAGRKDLRLVSSGRPWPLIHLPLGPSAWGDSWGGYLQRCGEDLVQRGVEGDACFAIDGRLKDHVDWLAAEGIQPGAVCTVYSLPLSWRPPPSAWVHMPTSEI